MIKEPDYKNSKHIDEQESRSSWLDKSSFRIVLISTFIGLAVVAGYMLVILPNIEVFTLMIFLSGFIMGRRDGALIGLMSSVVFCFFNPLGASDLFLFSVQVTYYTLVGLNGGLTRLILQNKDFFKPREDLYVIKVLVIFAVIGAVMTFIYDIFSTLAGSIFIFGTAESFWPTYLIGM